MTDNTSQSFPQPGFRASRRGGATEVVGWCPPGTRTKPSPKLEPPRHETSAALFGPDDQFVATVAGNSLDVSHYATIGHELWKPFMHVTVLPARLVRLYAAGTIAPYVLYAIDVSAKCWRIDFRAHHGRPCKHGLALAPHIVQIACEVEHPVIAVVVVCVAVLVQVRVRRNVHEIWCVNPRLGIATRLGALELDGPVVPLDPARYSVLVGHLRGELRLVIVSTRCRGDAGKLEVLQETPALRRATAVALMAGSRAVVARKGGYIDSVDIHKLVPVWAACFISPIPNACRELRKLLRTCGCHCKCKCTDEDDTTPDPLDPGDDEPCGLRQAAKLEFTVHHLDHAGGHLIAMDKGGTKMAVLDSRLNIKVERSLDRTGVEVHAGQRHTQNLLVHVPRKEQFEAWDVVDYVREVERHKPATLLTSSVARAAPSAIYRGSRTERADLNPTMEVCVFPVIDGGQTYGDPDMTKLVDQVSAKMFTTVNNYYDECSFGEMAINFTVFGHDFGGARKPLVLPRAQESYWREDFRAGGLQVLMPADFASPILFDGTEALEIQANPRAGAVKTYDVPFATMWSSGNLGNFPVTLTFAGTETLELTVETQNGGTHLLVLNFPGAVLTANQEEDVPAFLNDLGSLLTDAIRTAEADIAMPTLIQDVLFRRVRVTSADTAFGMAQGQFRVVSLGDGAIQKGRISVTGPASSAPPLLSLNLTLGGTISGVMNSDSAVRSFFRQCLMAAQLDAGEGIGGSDAYFNTSVRTDLNPVAQEITIFVDLSANTGGQMATMEVISSSGLAGTGWDTAQPNPGSTSNANNQNTLRDAIELANDTFTAALEHIRATTVWDRVTVEALFAEFDVMMIAHVGAPHPAIPTADQWACDDPAGFGGKRMYKRTYFARDLNPPGGEAPVQMGTSNITGQRFNSFNNAMMENQGGVMAHELGHAAGLPDIYFATGYRDDVKYMSPWAMMGGGNTNFHHFCGWSKWKLGWIPDDVDPGANRTIFVDLPAAGVTTVTEAWLVPVEHWDDFMLDDVRSVVGGAVPIGQLMKLNLGSDGGVTAFLELRSEGILFSQNLSTQPTVIASNGLDPNSDRYWAVNGLYRRSVHLLNNGTELRNINDTWDFAKAPEFPIKGCAAEVADIRTVRGFIPVYRVQVKREQAEYIDLHFQDHVPSWKSPDIWVDWPGDNPDPGLPRVYPVGTPSDQGETVRFPASGTEKHYVVARVHNAGNVSAEKVRVRWFVCDPPGSGDDGRWVNRGTQIIPEIGPGANEITAFEWNVDASTNVHQCMRMEIIDWKIPDGVDPATGDTVALASDDVKLQNNNAQQNVFDFEALGGSPFDVITFPFQVHNDRVDTEIAALVPKGLPHGSTLTVTPQEQPIPSGERRIFTCKLELDDTVIRPGCDNDSRFALTAWRRDIEADEIWGSCFYYVRPRFRTRIRITRGSWSFGRVNLYGVLGAIADPSINIVEDMPLEIRIRFLVDSGKIGPVWNITTADADGTFKLDVNQKGNVLIAQAWYDRSDRLGSSVSNTFEMRNIIIG